jgi:chemotaxis protein methyltransferase CheR
VTLRAEDFDYMCELVREESGMVLEDGKEYLVESRLRAMVQRERLPDISALLRLLKDDDARGLRERAVEGLLIGETQFFRDGHPFDTIREFLLPELIVARKAARELSFWCAAASTGQEPYSLAMLLTDDFPELGAWRTRIVASDLSQRLLARAAAGVYSEFEVRRGLPPALRDRHFEQSEGGWTLSERIRKRVEFERINLIRDWPTLPPMDLVLARNVLIYFADATRRVLVDKIRRQVRRGGFLLFGTTESLHMDLQEFEPVRFGRTLCYRRC